jgi:transposase-like protein
MFTDVEDRKSKKRLRGVDSVGKHWSDKQKLEAVTTYLMLGGNLRLTSYTLKIPDQTLYMWKKSEWWNKLVSEVKQEERLTVSSRLKKVMDKSWDVVADRLEHGDWIYDQKAGELRRKPVSLRDAAKVANDASLLRERLDMNDNFTVAADQIEDKLSKLAKAFTDLSKGITKPETVAEDIEFVEELPTDPTKEN